MRVFEYSCEKCGDFEMLRPSGLHRHPAPCPSCGKLSPRIISAPNLQQIDPGQKSRIERNIKSQFEPHVCGPNCQHEASSLLPPKSLNEKPKVQSYNGPRSWVIEHAV